MKKLLKILSVSAAMLLVGTLASCAKKEKETASQKEEEKLSENQVISVNPKDGVVSGGDAACVHKWGDFKVEVAPKCEENGSAKATCKDCGATNTVVLEATGHKFTNYVSDNNASMLMDGTKTAHCDHDGCDKTDTVRDPGTKLDPTADVLLYSKGIQSLFNQKYLLEIKDLSFKSSLFNMTTTLADFYLSVDENDQLIGFGSTELVVDGFVGTNVKVNGTAILENEEILIKYQNPDHDDIVYDFYANIPLASLEVDEKAGETALDYFNQAKSIYNKVAQEVDNLDEIVDKTYLNSAILLSAGLASNLNKKVEAGQIVYTINYDNLKSYNEDFYTLTIDKLFDKYIKEGLYAELPGVVKPLLTLKVGELLDLAEKNGIDLVGKLTKLNSLVSEVSNGEYTKIEDLYSKKFNFPITSILTGDKEVKLLDTLPQQMGVNEEQIAAYIDQFFETGKNKTVYDLLLSLDEEDSDKAVELKTTSSSEENKEEEKPTAKDIHDGIDEFLTLFARGSTIEITTTLQGELKDVKFTVNNFNFEKSSLTGEITLVRDGQTKLDFDSAKNIVTNKLSTLNLTKALVETLNQEGISVSATTDASGKLTGIKVIEAPQFYWPQTEYNYETSRCVYTYKGQRVEKTFDLSEPYALIARDDCTGYAVFDISAKCKIKETQVERVETKQYNEETYEYDILVSSNDTDKSTTEETEYESLDFMYDITNAKLSFDTTTKHSFKYSSEKSIISTDCMHPGERHYVCETCGYEYVIPYQADHAYEYTYKFDNDETHSCSDGVEITKVCSVCGDKSTNHYDYHKTLVIKSFDLTDYGIIGSVNIYECPCDYSYYYSESFNSNCEYVYSDDYSTYYKVYENGVAIEETSEKLAGSEDLYKKVYRIYVGFDKENKTGTLVGSQTVGQPQQSY